jgi:hypothetical protein
MGKGRSGSVPVQPFCLTFYLKHIKLDTVNVRILAIFYLLPNQQDGEISTAPHLDKNFAGWYANHAYDHFHEWVECRQRLQTADSLPFDHAQAE